MILSTGCTTQPTKRLPPAAPELQKIEVIKYRPLPSECTDAVDFVAIQRGQTNEDLARAHRENLKTMSDANQRLQECRDLPRRDADTDPSG